MPNSARSRTSAESGTQRERVRTDGETDDQVAQDRRQPELATDDDRDDRRAEQEQDQLRASAASLRTPVSHAGQCSTAT